MKYLLIAPLMFLFSLRLYAQNAINTDRPDQSDGTHIVESGYLQIETGVQFSGVDKAHDFDNSTLIRYGVSKKFEVRLLNDYTALQNNSISGFQPFTVSFKNQLCRQHGLLPKVTLVSYFRLPVTVSKPFPGNHFGYTFTLAARHDVIPAMKFYSNFGVTQDQQSAKISYLGTAELNYNITSKLSTFLEYFGNYALHTNASNGTDIGFIYALTNNLAADLAFGSPTLKKGVDKFITFGGSVRLPK